MATEDTPTEPSSALAGIAAAVPLLAVLLGCGFTGAFFSAQPASMQEIGLFGAIPLVLFVLAAVLAAVLLFLMGRGRAIPSAVLLGVAVSPWVIGLFLASWSMLGVGDALASAEPSLRSMLLSRAVTNAIMAGATGSIAGGTLLTASALGLGLASVAQRAPNRVVWAGVLGFFVVLPMAAAAGYGILAEELFVAVPVMAALTVAVGAALGVGGAGADERGRSGALSSAVPWLGGLGVLALVSAAAHRSTLLIFSALAMAPADMRLELMAHAAEEMGPLLAARWTVPVCVVLAACAVAGWAALRRRPGVGQLVGAGALVLGFLAVLGIDAVSRMQALGLTPASDTPAPPGFRAETLDTGLGDRGPINLFVGRHEIVHAHADEGGSTRSLRDAFARVRASAEPPVATASWLDAPAEVVLALDERAPGSVLQGLAAAARASGVRSLGLATSSPLSLEQRASLESAVPSLAVVALSSQDDNALRVIVARDEDLARAQTDPLFLHTRVDGTAPDTLEANPGVSLGDRELVTELFGHGADEAPEGPAWVEVGPQATAESLLRTVARLHASGRVPVLVESMPQVASRAQRPDSGAIAVLRSRSQDSALGTLLGTLGEENGGRGLFGNTRPPTRASEGTRASQGGARRGVPRVRFDRPTVRGSLSPEVIRRVMRRHMNEVRFCYERELTQRPNAAGTVTLSYVIGPSGRVTTSNARSADVPPVASCISGAARRWMFPSPDGGGVVMVDQGITLSTQ